MQRNKKQQVVESMREKINNAQTLIVVHYQGLNVSELTELRRAIRENDGSFEVTKNSLAKIALGDTAYKELAEFFTGPTAIAYANDSVSVAKAIVKFAKDNENLTLLGGASSEEEGTFDASNIKALASLPSIEESRAKIVGILTTPASRLVSVLQAPAGQVARVIGAYGSKEG